MRRKDREVVDENRIHEIIEQCQVCRIGMIENNEVYIVPLNYGYVHEDGKYVLYFHGSLEGRKMNILRKNPHVGFEMDCSFHLNPAEKACDYSATYASIIGNGTIEILSDFEEKKKGLQIFMEHFTKRSNWNFPDHAIRGVAVMKMTLDEFSCKEHK